jgi:hypothetical protein
MIWGDPSILSFEDYPIETSRFSMLGLIGPFHMFHAVTILDEYVVE